MTQVKKTGTALPITYTALLRMRDSILEKNRVMGPVLAGSLVKNKGTGYVLTDKVRGKTRTMYIAEQMYEQAKVWNERHREAKRLLQELSEIQRELIRLESERSK
jgi:hypothetical protein